MAGPRQFIAKSPAPYDASDPEAIEKAKAASGLRQSGLDKVLAGLLADYDGREGVWDLLSRCNCYETSFVPGDPGEMAFREGRRTIGLSLIADVVRTYPEGYVLMQREAHDRATSGGGQRAA